MEDLDLTNNGSDFPDLDFIYADTDSHSNEIAELYSYTEFSEFQHNVKAFEDQMESFNLPPSWQKLSPEQHKRIVLKLMDQLDVSKKETRMKAARCILYLTQGCWAEVQSDQEQQAWTRSNVMLLYKLGVFQVFVELLNLEIENSYTAHIAIHKVAVSLAESVDLRLILSVLYIITEVIRSEKEKDSEDFKSIAENFRQDLIQPIGDELLSVKLLGMITRFCSGTDPHFPIKKILLLLWKVSLVGLGGMEELKIIKNEYRAKAGLSLVVEDTLEISRVMRASTPPPLPSTDDDSNVRRKCQFRRSLIKQSSLDEEQMGMEMDAQSEDLSEYYRQYEDPNNLNNSNNNGAAIEGSQFQPPTFNPEPPERPSIKLPWTPKVRQKDIDQFLQCSRSKFIGYTLPDDHETLAGLPQPIHEGFRILKKHIYVSLSDIQIRKEEEIARNPLIKCEGEISMTPTETLYQAILPNLPQYMISLLKILLAAAPTSKAKTESINIMADVLPEEMPISVTQSTKLGIDVNRHKEIIVKTVSAILLLYLKHFKINHIYQFEFMAQHLAFANCIPLVLKFFNQNLMDYVGSKNGIPILDFPSCVIGEQPELTPENLVIGDSAPYSWRNIFSSINLLRILNKITKWKNSRIMMLVVFKSSPILKRAFRVRHAMMQLYVLKLLKMQTKYLGRQWRKTHMKIISAIYSKVRHRLNDDWAFGNDLDARPWDFQAEECTLRTCVDRFNNRRYLSQQHIGGIRDYNEYDMSGGNLMNTIYGYGVNNGNGIINLGQPHQHPDDENELSEEFKQNYELWLEHEVYNVDLNWDSLMVAVDYA